jgi:asparagine synthase (glutamine-hydrolysing)
VPHPLSAFESINKLAPAHTLVVEDGRPTIRPYWSIDFADKREGESASELAEQLLERIDDATRVRLMSEVPLGAFLSGGIDSSAVVASMAAQSASPVKTFSIGFGEADFDELRYARTVAERFGTDHHEFQVEPDAVEVLPTLARHYGEPFADPAAIPTFYLAEMTSRHVTVALNGDGGDELFAGYPRYVGNALALPLGIVPSALRHPAQRVVDSLPDRLRTSLPMRRVRHMLGTFGMSQAERYASWMTAFSADQRGRLRSDAFSAELNGWRSEGLMESVWTASQAHDPVERMLDTDIRTYLADDLLAKVDIATMAHSVEARSPILDQGLVEFMASLPRRMKLRGFGGKRLLRLALRDRLPEEILRRPKMGFAVPLVHWFRNELRSLPAELLLDPATIERGYFRREEVERLIAEHQSGKEDHALRLWTLIQLETWQREVVERDR